MASLVSSVQQMVWHYPNVFNSLVPLTGTNNTFVFQILHHFIYYPLIIIQTHKLTPKLMK